MKELQLLLREFTLEVRNKVTELNAKRAQSFHRYAQDLVKTGQAGLKHNSSLTKKISGGHYPLYNTGGLIKAMKVFRNKDTSVDVGYRASDGSKPKGSKINYNKIGLLLSSGFRIPLSGEKGRRVQGWFAYNHGVYFKKNRSFLIVRPRPFLHNAVKRYIEKGKDHGIIEDHIEVIIRKAVNVR